MKPTTDLIRAFLTAEGAGREAEAERGLARLLRRLPLAHPRAGFADRVLAAAFPSPMRRSGWAAVLVLAAACVAVSPLALLVLAAGQGVGPAGLLGRSVGLLLGLDDLLGALVGTWNFLGGVSHVFHLVAVTPEGLSFIVGCLVVATLSCTALHSLLRAERTGYVL